jgi:hypothetical protein
MLNHLLLGQTVTRPNGFWRTPQRHGERHHTRSAVLMRRGKALPRTLTRQLRKSR